MKSWDPRPENASATATRPTTQGSPCNHSRPQGNPRTHRDTEVPDDRWDESYTSPGPDPYDYTHFHSQPGGRTWRAQGSPSSRTVGTRVSRRVTSGANLRCRAAPGGATRATPFFAIPAYSASMTNARHALLAASRKTRPATSRKTRPLEVPRRPGRLHRSPFLPGRGRPGKSPHPEQRRRASGPARPQRPRPRPEAR